MYYIHKHRVFQQYGGPEEGGWWYDSGHPVSDWIPPMCEDKETAYLVCRALNNYEDERAKKEEKYGYTSVLSYESTHYSYSVEEFSEAKPYPEVVPHYE